MAFKTRCSKSGLYNLCGYSATLDEAIQAGAQPVLDDMDFSSSAYADLGTIIHNELQVRLGCVMQERLPGMMEPMWLKAQELFKDREELEAVVSRAVEFAAGIFPKALDGKPWVAEPEDALTDLTGHLDFESQDLSEIIDLKTTARKPDHGRLKPLHLYQLVSYWELRGRKAKTGRILYVDSLKGDWAIMSDPVDFQSDAIAFFAEGMAERRKDIFNGTKRFFPVPGDHCKSGFCSYRNSRVCYSGLVPPGGTLTLNKGAKTKNDFAHKEGPKEVKLW
jgi:hypothetical protein